MKKINSVFLLVWFIAYAVKLDAQEIAQQDIYLDPVRAVNFIERADFEAAHPLLKSKRFIEQGEDREKDFVPQPVPSDAVSVDAPPTQHQHRAGTNSPAPSVSFNGTLDNGTLIPPDIRGAAGPNHVMETTNQEFKIYTKTGALVSTVSIPTFFAVTGGRGYFDPHVLYDPTNNRWLICVAGTHSSGHMGIFLAVSHTTDPTGSWFAYSFDGIGNTYDFLDYPLMGYNANWVVITGNDFMRSGNITGKIYVMNRASLYSGTLGTVSAFTDATVFSLAPAQTFDVAQTTLYMVQNWNGNSNGSGYVRIRRITGTPNAPVYSVGSFLGVTQPWSNSTLDVPQAGTTNRIDAGDSRVGNAVYRNGSLWFCQTAFLPASSPTRSAVQWWQVNPATTSLQQFGRVDGGSPTGTFYSYPGIAVNAGGDVLLGHCQSSSTSYASASYSTRASTDAVNTMQTVYVYKAGLASYYKTFGGNRNRWGDYTGASVDPSNNSFWNFNQWALTGNKWGTQIANVAVPPAVPCNVATGLSTSGIGNNSATFSWAAVPGATNYTLHYRPVGIATWTTITSATTTYIATGLAAGTNYEWQVQTVCTGGTSPYISSVNFITTGIAVCNVPGSGTTTSIAITSARLNWVTTTGAISYNVQYRPTGTTIWSTVNTANTYYMVSGLTAGTTYEWQVKSVCQSSTSAYSISYLFTTTAGLPCDLPVAPNTIEITTTTARLQWEILALDTSYKYNVRYRVVGASLWTTVFIPYYSTPLHFAIGLTAMTDYEWQVQTVCTGGASAYTSSQTFTTAATEWCITPTNTGYTNATTTSVVLGWAAVNGAISYNIRYRLNPGNIWMYASSSTNSFTLTGLSANTFYAWQVQTVCAAGITAYSFLQGILTASTGTCSPSSQWGGTAGGYATTASINWSAVGGALSYNLRYRVVGAPAWTTLSVIGTSYNFTNLTPGLSYEWQTQTVCSGGTSGFRPALSMGFNTASTTSCSLPVQFGIYPNYTTSTSVRFSAFGFSGTNEFNMRYRPVGSSAWTILTMTDPYTVYYATGLTPGTEYELQGQMVCTTGASAYVAGDNFTTTGAAYCNKVTGLLTTSITNNSATLKWWPGSSATGYHIRYRPVGTYHWASGVSAGTSYSPVGLIAGTEYEWQAQQVCATTISAYANFASFTTAGAASCPIPTNLTTVSITPSSASFNWSAAAGAMSYNIQYRVIGSSTWLSGISSSNIYNATGLTPATEYEWKVQTRCSTDTSWYVTSQAFATVSAPVCSDVYESNNTSGTAFLATINTGFTGLLTPSTDVDWYKFTATSPYTNAEIDLTNLPADYDMQLYASNATTLLGTAQNRGTANEQIKYPASATSTYYLKVYGYNGANSALCYRLQVAASSLAYSPLPSPDEIRSDIRDTIEMEQAMKVYPNPATHVLHVEFVSSNGGKTNLNVYNLAGQKVLNVTTTATEGLNTQTVNTNILSNGVYVFEVQNNGETQRQQFEIVK